MEIITGSTPTTSIRVLERSQAGEARRLATAMAASLGFSTSETGKVSIVVTEIASNMVKHAQSGELLFRPLQHRGIAGLEILALDKGPGMPDVEKCLQDGYSTAGSPGTGLGAVSRLSSTFEIFSQPQFGTIVLCRFWAGPLPVLTQTGFELGGVSVPVEGEQLCGDAWAAMEQPGRLVMMVADGLGHGQFASEAAEAAVHIFREYSHLSPEEIIEYADSALRSTRGAALAVAEINLRQQMVHFAGVGNIAAAILGEGANIRSMISHNGIVGHQMRKLRQFEYPWHSEAILVMNSDGLRSRWTLESAGQIRRHHPTLMAAWLYRDFKRERDDVTVTVARSIMAP